MIRTLRALFLRRDLREKAAIVGLIALAVLVWGYSYAGRAGASWHAHLATANALKDQANWLARSGEIEAATRAAASQMDPAKTLDPTNLSVVVTQLATDAGVHLTSIGASAALNSGQFSINGQRFRIDNTDWHAFAVFYQHLQEKAPYIAITELAMNPVRGNPSQIIATIAVASFEIRH